MTRDESAISCSVSLQRTNNSKQPSNIISYLLQHSQEVYRYLQFEPIRIYADYKELTRANTPSNNFQQATNPPKGPNISATQNSPNEEKVV